METEPRPHNMLSSLNWQRWLWGWFFLTNSFIQIFTARKRSCGMVIFLHPSVIMFTWGGGVYIPAYNGRGVYTHSPLGRHPFQDCHWSGWYASYWNAFLFFKGKPSAVVLLRCIIQLRKVETTFNVFKLGFAWHEQMYLILSLIAFTFQQVLLINYADCKNRCTRNKCLWENVSVAGPGDRGSPRFSKNKLRKRWLSNLPVKISFFCHYYIWTFVSVESIYFLKLKILEWCRH